MKKSVPTVSTDTHGGILSLLPSSTPLSTHNDERRTQFDFHELPSGHCNEDICETKRRPTTTTTNLPTLVKRGDDHGDDSTSYVPDTAAKTLLKRGGDRRIHQRSSITFHLACNTSGSYTRFCTHGRSIIATDKKRFFLGPLVPSHCSEPTQVSLPDIACSGSLAQASPAVRNKLYIIPYKHFYFFDPTEKTQQLEGMVAALEKTTQQLHKKLEMMENQYDTLRQLINDTDTKLLVTIARQEKDIQTLQTNVTSSQNTKTMVISTVDITAPTFSGESKKEHSKQFLKDMHNYLDNKQITARREKMIVIENNLRGKASKWYTMIKYAALDEVTFSELFLKHFFSENHQWEIFIKCTEAGKNLLKRIFRNIFIIGWRN
ncbi:hypothetical protein AGLY_004098 [Aphis glycines]|uniref:Uncharacterized protein n=1 Tax=Aphis glycines TaxID=307491 RepID=A0A6G0TZF8_APHGL|nr:hypothetical protein AGLY_004098 [Aphis glycines]